MYRFYTLVRASIELIMILTSTYMDNSCML